MSGLWEEVKTRKIFKAATIYAAVAWGIIQIADILIPVLGISDKVMSSMVLVAFAGFPLALVAGWMLDIKIERKRANQIIQEQSAGVANASIGARIAELAVISLFGAGAAYLYYNSVSEPVQASGNELVVAESSFQLSNNQKAIAVLPFANFSDSTEDEYFADGLSEELLNVLARNKKLRVVARTSSFQYKNTNINIKTIAQELGVQYILEGSVRRSGDLIRVTAQLIKADEDVHIFSKTWDRNTTNVFKVQDEISQSVLDELKISLLGEAEQELSKPGTEMIAAMAEYSRGLALLRNRGKSDLEKAVVHFKQALEIDAGYAQAMTMLAETYLLQFSYGLIDFSEALSMAKPQIIRALELNPKLGAIHAVKGLMHWQLASQLKKEKTVDEVNQELEVAKEHFIKALDINPSLAEAYMWYGTVLQQQGDFVSGADLRKRAYEIDPRAAVVGYNRAKDLIRFGEYEQAMNVFNVVVRNNPNYASAYDIAGDVSYSVGQLDQAYSMFNRFAELSEDDTMWLVNSSRIFISMGEFQRAQLNLDELLENEKADYNEKFYSLQASLWIASGNFRDFHQWTGTFKEDSSHWSELFWRGLGSLQQEKWQFAIDDLSNALALIRHSNNNRVDEMTIRIQLFIARAYQGVGNALKTAHYLKLVAEEIQLLTNQGFDNKVVRYQQAALAALNDEPEQAIALLRQSVQEGFVDFWWTETDPSFHQVRDVPAFAVLRDEFSIRMRLMQNSIESQYGVL